MDPILLFFTAYLHSVQNLALIPPHVTESTENSHAALSINYKGNSVPFQYDNWTIEDQSVCKKFPLRSTRYSNCAVQAHELFDKLCMQLQQTASEDFRFQQTKAMYCNAAASYQPSQAIVVSDLHKSLLRKAKKNCSTAIMFVMSSREAALIGNRNRLCSSYIALKKSILET